MKPVSNERLGSSSWRWQETYALRMMSKIESEREKHHDVEEHDKAAVHVHVQLEPDLLPEGVVPLVKDALSHRSQPRDRRSVPRREQLAKNHWSNANGVQYLKSRRSLFSLAWRPFRSRTGRRSSPKAP